MNWNDEYKMNLVPIHNFLLNIQFRNVPHHKKRLQMPLYVDFIYINSSIVINRIQ